ncbi:MAG: SPOR domain-containing protein [Ignavibacteriae bacterium]|nr:MAG: SPOR domain-containing protein [Ignavibacteriota bacterium]
MPDLNLIDEGGFEDVPEAPVAPPAKKSAKSSGGGGGKSILLVVVMLCIVAAAVYFLNQRGIIKLWGKRQQQVAQVQEEQFTPETAVQTAPAPVDTGEVALLDTAPLEEKTEGAKEPESKIAEPSVKKGRTLKSEAVMETESSSKLGDMKGEFTVQVIAYREKARAVETAKNLEFSGYPSFVEKIPMKGGDWYTVRIGRYATRDEAKKAVDSFGEQLQAHYVIDKVRLK